MKLEKTLAYNQIILSNFYLASTQELTFTASQGETVLNLILKDNLLFIENSRARIRIKDQGLINLATEQKQNIIKDINCLWKNILAGKEELLFFPLVEDDYPYFLTTPTILENGHFSIKYYEALVYAFNQGLKKQGKSIHIWNYENLVLNLKPILKETMLQNSQYNNEAKTISFGKLLSQF